MEYAIKKNGMYESIPFNTNAVQTEGRGNITLQAKVDDAQFVNYLAIPKCNVVTKLDIPGEVTLKLVSKYPFNYTLPGIEPRYLDKHKIEDFLYEILYGNIDYDYAYQYFIDSEPGGCSSIRNGNYFGRNFDWIYNNDVLFVVHTPQSLNRHAVLGVSGIIPGITKNTVDQEEITYQGKKMFKLLPFYLLDGINDKGLFCTHNVVPLDDEDNPTIRVVAKKEERDKVCATMLVRYILDRFNTALEAINYIRDYVTVYFSDLMIESWYYLTHLLIGDLNSTYVVEFINNELVVHKWNYITNFQITGVLFNNKHIESPYILHGINKFGFGLERWNILTDTKSNTLESMRKALNIVKYSNTYNPDNFLKSELVRYLDNNDEFITVDTPEELCSLAKEELLEAFSLKDRDNPQVWITCHSSIYNIKNKILYIRNQENLTEYAIKLII